MQREIKFRCWQKYHKRMLEVLSISFEEGKIKSIHIVNGKNIAPRTIIYSGNKSQNDFWLYDENGIVLELLQYTGLKDKNNKEIYEGDIVEDDKYIFKVVWHQQGAKYYLEFIDWKDKLFIEKDLILDILNNQNLGDGYLKRRDLKVIGNIYENPELIKNE